MTRIRPKESPARHAKRLASQRARRAAKQANGTCLHCASPAVPKASMCQPCGFKHVQTQAKAAGSTRMMVGAKYHPEAAQKLTLWALWDLGLEKNDEARAWIATHADEWREKSDPVLWNHVPMTALFGIGDQAQDGDCAGGWTPVQPYFDRLGRETSFEAYMIHHIDQYREMARVTA